MVESKRPLLFLPEPTKPDRLPGGPKFPRMTTPGYGGQKRRLDQKFQRIQDALTRGISASDDPGAIVPERALVFEVYGSLLDFEKLCKQLGFEWLFDADEELELNEGFSTSKAGEKTVGGHLYLSMPTKESLNKLLTLWRRFKRGESASYGDGDWWKLFEHLKDIRPWGPQDRLVEDDRERWEELLDGAPDEMIRVEAELWFHRDAVKQAKTETELRERLTQLGVTVLDHDKISEILYSAFLLDVPRGSLNNLFSDPVGVELLRIDHVMFVRPQSLASAIVTDEPTPGDWEAPLPLKEPIRGALLDGLPVQNHPLLDGLLEVDDPDGVGDDYPVNQRSHGTAMASLILHGDLHENGPSLTRKLYVRPVFTGDPNDPAQGREGIDDFKLFLPLINRAVKRIKKGDEGEDPAASTVVVINHSLGDRYRPFGRFISPWARLLDYLAYDYNVLFVVSAGNCMDFLPIIAYDNEDGYRNANPTDREKEVIRSLEADRAARRMLTPGESINALTVGALHLDGRPSPPVNMGMLVNPLPTLRAPALYSRVGLGYRGGVKPEVLNAGGRSAARIDGGMQACALLPRETAKGYGQSAAAPPPPGIGDVNRHANSSGTSNAAALTTRAALMIIDELEALTDDSGTSGTIGEKHLPVVAKALVSHGARWGEFDADGGLYVLPNKDKENWQPYRNRVTRLLGYGAVDVDWVLNGTQHRVTLIGAGEIGQDEARKFTIPVPVSLFGKPVKRRVTATLAWLTPVNPNHQQYRRAILELAPAKWSKDNWPAAKGDGIAQPVDTTADKGTLIHRIWQEKSAKVLAGSHEMAMVVQCRSPMKLDGTVPFALAVTIEVASAIGANVDIHQEVRTALRPRVPAAVG